MCVCEGGIDLNRGTKAALRAVVIFAHPLQQRAESIVRRGVRCVDGHRAAKLHLFCTTLYEEREEEDPTESLLWVYIDADDAEFGPFARGMMRGWLAGGMIPRELRVRPASRDDLDFKPIDELFGESSQPFFYISSETMDK